MRNMQRTVLMSITCAIALFVSQQMSIAMEAGAPRGKSMPILRGFSMQLTLGLKDKQPTNWTGTIEVSEGRLIRLDAQAGRNDWIRNNAWRLRTRRSVRRRGGGMRPVQLIAMFDAPPDAKVEVTT